MQLDTIVLFHARKGQEETIAAAMRDAGGNVETKTYPGVNHVDIMLALSRPLRGRAPTLADVTAFVERVSA